ncbi:hypothetical protein [Janibacter sp. G1551]|uniref:hypothetical protein n=1 Tax=Janibacter sp. G1551 TaxID=3420440 RepID=UPI003D013BF1
MIPLAINWTWVDQFVRSPGFGGTAAVCAALIAFWAASRSRRAEDRRAREARWWEQARWATELVREDDDHSIHLGVTALRHLLDEDIDVEAARFAGVVMEELLPKDDVDINDEDLDTGSKSEEVRDG